MFKKTIAALLPLLLATLAPATETENLGIAVLPTPAKVTVDGQIADWDLSGGIFACGDVENQRERFAVWIHAMYDADNLYVLARWVDETPLNNPGQVVGSYGFAGDCLQMRLITAPGTPGERGSHWTCWQGRSGDDVMFVERGVSVKDGEPTIKDAQTLGAQQAFSKHADSKGYDQEIAIPWKMLTTDGQSLRPGESFTMTVEPNFTVGGNGRLSIKDIFKAGETPDRVFTFMSNRCWGAATLRRSGRIEPPKLRLSDARELSVRLDAGAPVIDWSGLTKTEASRGFKTIAFTMPEDGYVSLHVVDGQGQVVCQLLNAAPYKKGPHEVKWDGLGTKNWRTPGDPAPAGNYTWRAIWHTGVGLRLRGWAANGGSAPWSAGPTTNWGGDHGIPVACAADAGKVYLGWSGSEAGDALLACDLAGNVLWKNSRQGMCGAQFAAVADGMVYAANWGSENGNYIYRLHAESGAYAELNNNSPDLLLADLFPDGRQVPNRIDGLAAGDGKIYLSLVSAQFRREQIVNWRGLLEKIKAGKGPGARIWDNLDQPTRDRAEKWLAANVPEGEGLQAPNYYTPGVHDAVVSALNELLKDTTLVPHAGDLSGDALALANRRYLEEAFGGEVVKLQTSMVAVVDPQQRKLLRTCPIANPRHLCAVSAKLVYVVSDGKQVVALDPTSGSTRAVVDGLKNATGVAVDAEGNIYVGTRGPDNQVHVFSADGKPLRSIGRRGGRPDLGPWQSDGMAHIEGIAVATDGKLWVAEADAAPKRISVWDAKTGQFLREFFGPSSYGATGGAINPLDPGIMVGQGCEWRLDPQTGHATCLGVVTRGGMENARFGVGSNGRLYLAVASGWAYRCDRISIFERLGDGDYKLRSSFDLQGSGKDGTTACWVDENGDAQQQPGEVSTVDGQLRFSGWYMNFAADMTFYVKDAQYRVAGFTPCGAPKHDLAHPQKMPAEGWGSADGKLVVRGGDYGVDSGWFDCFEIGSGRKRWSYPDNFVGVHGSHRAPPPTVGMIRGSFGPTGTAKLPAPIGNLWVIPTNCGEWHLLNEDGFYVAKLFQGDPMNVRWPDQAVPGAVMDDCPPGAGGEDFGGSIACTPDGKLFVQAGKTGYWNLEVVGLPSMKALPGGEISISDADVQEAKKLRAEYLQEAVGLRKLAIKKATPGMTGDLNRDFAGATIIEYQKQETAKVRSAAAWDDRNLYLAWEVRDPTPWLNAATAPEQMYTGGDTVDFQLAADPKAAKDRGEAVAGDLRLSIGNSQGQPTAVLYRKVSAVKKPKQFTSGVVKDYAMDYVDVLAGVKIKITPRGKEAYVVEAAVPWSDLGVQPAEGLKLQADFGVTHGGPDGGRTRLRTYWNNQHTGIVDDAVFELQMEPKYWGEVEFQQ